MAVVGLQSDNECCYIGQSGGKRLSMYITSILPNRAPYRWLLIEYYENGLLVRFLVGVLAISAQRARYYRFFTATISAVR